MITCICRLPLSLFLLLFPNSGTLTVDPRMLILSQVFLMTRLFRQSLILIQSIVTSKTCYGGFHHPMDNALLKVYMGISDPSWSSSYRSKDPGVYNHKQIRFFRGRGNAKNYHR
jgi:hypothetical protein